MPNLLFSVAVLIGLAILVMIIRFAFFQPKPPTYDETERASRVNPPEFPS